MEPGQIRRRAVQFYSSLYSSEFHEEQAALQEEFCSAGFQFCRRSSAETNSRLEEPLQMWELQAALQSMQGRRAPGVDGLTVEFFKAFWDIFATDILDVFNESLASGSMPMSCRRAVLTLLPKKGNLQDIKNWRPVSLLCVDYKLLSKALANRLRGAMEQVIHQDQTYCVPGRSMVDNIYLIRGCFGGLQLIGPPVNLLAQIQKKRLIFFGMVYTGCHKGVLFLAREEGGQGLVQLASRTATFGLQFVQKYLTGPADLVWRDVASCILRRANDLGLDAALFLTDCKFLKLSGLPPFYQGVFKSWALFDKKRCQKSASLHWLLKEPLIHGARLDITSGITPGLTVALRGSGTLCLQQLVDALGPALSDAVALGSLLGLHSVRVAQRILQLCRQKLSGKERSFLMNYSQERATPDPTDPFPEINLSLELGDLTGPLLDAINPNKMTLHRADKKTIYFNCVKVINKNGLSNRPPTVWTQRLSGGTEPSPQWRILYKPPLKKRTGDLQWRILHGAIASNAFISVLNPVVSSRCPFCERHETVYHVFTECQRLTELFALLTSVFSLFGVAFTKGVFIMGAGYKKTDKERWQLLNFLTGEAKMAIYVSRKNRVENREGTGCQVSLALQRQGQTLARIQVELLSVRLSHQVSMVTVPPIAEGSVAVKMVELCSSTMTCMPGT
ncbi:hypothetical protein L3Q82_022640, partial [Scortum barcoo]